MAVTIYELMFPWDVQKNLQKNILKKFPKKTVKYLLGEATEFDRLYWGLADRDKHAEAVAIRNANIAAEKKQMDLAAQQLATQQQAAQQQERLSNEERIRALMRAQSRGAIAGE